MKFEESQLLLLSEAVTKWGEHSQKSMAVEECGELIVAIQKENRVGGRETYQDAATKVIDEIADVMIMMEQLALIYGHEAVRQRVKFKIDRLKTRLEQ